MLARGDGLNCGNCIKIYSDAAYAANKEPLCWRKTCRVSHIMHDTLTVWVDLWYRFSQTETFKSEAFKIKLLKQAGAYNAETLEIFSDLDLAWRAEESRQKNMRSA